METGLEPFLGLLGDGDDMDGFAIFLQLLFQVLRAAQLVVDQYGGYRVGHQAMFILNCTRVPAGLRHRADRGWRVFPWKPLDGGVGQVDGSWSVVRGRREMRGLAVEGEGDGVSFGTIVEKKN